MGCARFLRLVVAGAVSAVLAGVPWSSVHADLDLDPAQNPLSPGVTITADTGSGDGPIDGSAIQAHDPATSTFDYEWVLVCFDNYPGQQNELCASASSCAGQGELRWSLWARQLTDEAGDPTPGATWEIISTECTAFRPAEPAVAPAPQVSDAVVLEEVRRLGLPRLTVRVQPAGETLVNFDTIFYAEPPRWARSVVLLGFDVDVAAVPAGYAWLFGDGTSVSTTTPGGPYPAKDITHRYTDAHVTVSARVDTAYQVRYRVDGGPWQTITDTVPAAGLPVDLRIREAVPVLVGN